MLIMAPYLPSDSIPLVVYNMSSYAEGYTVLRGLNPLNFYEAGISLIPNFSEWYASFVINNWQSMKELVDITRLLYKGNDVMILTNPSLEFSNTLSEALSDLIYKRYGYVSNIVPSLDKEDIPYLKEGEFSPLGMRNFDSDLSWYLQTFGEGDLVTANTDIYPNVVSNNDYY